ncbi:hypothetical protein EV126DRAFT_15738 [Verticillium dahliae]|nr:hypothetical protein EV126DRAFT_15738 [Verticillium dahliae]
MSLQDCPAEILLNIFQHLDSSGLALLSATSQTIHHVIEPHLYSSIQFTWTLEIRPPVILLPRTFLERPELASLVRSLTFAGNDGLLEEGIHSVVVPLSNPPALARRLFEAVKLIGLLPADINHWISRVQSGSADAVVAVLVSMTTGLKSLELSENWSAETRLLARMFRLLLRESAECDSSIGPLQKNHSFQSLIHVSITPWLNECCVFEAEEADRDILSLFYLPNIEVLSISVANHDPFMWPFKHDPTPLALTSLALSRIRESQLELILSAASNLTHFTYNWLFHEEGDRPQDALAPPSHSKTT